MNVLDRPDITSADFLDYLSGLRDTGYLIKDAADETVMQNQMISERVTAKINRRAQMRRELLSGVVKPVKAKKLKDVVALKKETGRGWSVFDSKGESKLGGPYQTEAEADDKLATLAGCDKKPKEKEKKKEIKKVKKDDLGNIKASDVYLLSKHTATLNRWSKVNSSAKVRAYIHSVNVGMQKLASRLRASSYVTSSSSLTLSPTPGFALRTIAEINRDMVTIASKGIGEMPTAIFAGVAQDLAAVSKLLKMEI